MLVVEEAKKRFFPELEKLYCLEMELVDHPLDDLEMINVDGKVKYVPSTISNETVATVVFGIIMLTFNFFVFGVWGGVVFLIKGTFDLDMIFGISYLSYELEVLKYLFIGYILFLIYKFFNNTYQFALLILLSILVFALFLFSFFCGAAVGIMLIFAIKFMLQIIG